MERKKFKAINFDLIIKNLEKYYPKHYTNAYKDIRDFFERNGFEHRQGSGYCSKDKITDSNVTDIIYSLKNELTWLPKCVSRLDVTDIGKNYDMTFILQNNKERVKQNQNSKVKNLNEWEKLINQKQVARENENNMQPREVYKNKMVDTKRNR